MKTIISATLALLLAVLPIVAAPVTAEAHGAGVACQYWTSDHSGVLRIEGAQGMPFRAHDQQGALRAEGVATSNDFAAAIGGAATPALIVTIGNQTICVFAEHDDIWQ